MMVVLLRRGGSSLSEVDVAMTERRLDIDKQCCNATDESEAKVCG
jgi:hypothetical protein